MPTATVLNEILEWSIDRPAWQRDALRRLVTRGSLHHEDILALAQLCKKARGLAEGPSPRPLTTNDIPSPDDASQSVSLTSLTHQAGVNALAPNQTIHFGPNLTVVYGENASGKSGYTRILKRACRARGAEAILGNVESLTAPRIPTAVLAFAIDGEPHSYRWQDDDTPNRHLSRISVFDHHSASVYIAQKTDVAFRPMGLDLFDKLSNACGAVKDILEKERQALDRSKLTLHGVPPDTQVGKLLSNLTSLTDPAEVRALASETSGAVNRRATLRSRLADLRSHDPDVRAREIESRAARVRALLMKLHTIAEVSSENFASSIRTTRIRLSEAREAIREHRTGAFEDQPFNNTGSAVWRQLWNAAQQFSEGEAYPAQPYPVIDDDSRCVLCQERLTEQARKRFQQFAAFIDSDLKKEYQRAKEAYATELRELREGITEAEEAAEMVGNLVFGDAGIQKSLYGWLKTCVDRMHDLRDGNGAGRGTAGGQRRASDVIEAMKKYAETLDERARELQSGHQAVYVQHVRVQLREEEAREVLREHLDEVLQDIERMKRVAVYQQCIGDTRTNAITRKSTIVTKRAVTEELKDAFQRELETLGFRHVEVDVAVAGGIRGTLYHKLRLPRAPGVEVSKVVSEGEARCLSIASFFAELSTAAHRSSILFDDPVSSLDHTWREKIAERLVREARSRQVVVFTHDIVFLLNLVEGAKKIDVDVSHQRLRRDELNIGLSSQEVPWIAMPVKKRIGHLKTLLQKASATYKKGLQDQYEQVASRIYGLLRETWERGFEEVLLGGTVERFRQSVETRRGRKLDDISKDDLAAVDGGMAKCSRWLTGHDTAPGGYAPFPDPSEVGLDIAALDEWVKGIHKRRR